MIKTIGWSLTIMTNGRLGSWLLVIDHHHSHLLRHDDRSLTITIVRWRLRCSLYDSDVQSLDHQRSWWLITNGQDDSEATIKIVRSQRLRRSVVMIVNRSWSFINGWSWSQPTFVANGHQWSLIKGLSDFFLKHMTFNNNNNNNNNIFQTHGFGSLIPRILFQLSKHGFGFKCQTPLIPNQWPKHPHKLLVNF